MSTTASLNEFITKVKSEGLLTGTHYYVVFGDEMGRIISMMCDSVNLPGMSNATTDSRLFGENREVPYMPIYPSLDLSFISDREMKIKQYFENWSNKVVDRTTRAVGYYSSYVKQLDIIITDKTGKAVYCARVFEAYPKAVQDIRFGFDNKDIIRINVTLAFKYWTQIPIGSSGTQNNFLQDLVKENIPSNFGGKGLERITNAIGGFGDNIPGLSGSAISSAVSSFPSNFATGAYALGKDLGADMSRVTSASYALLNTAPGGDQNTRAFGENILSLGKSSSDFGSAFSDLGQSITNFTTPVYALGNAAIGISNTLNAINATTSALGLGSPFSGIQSNLNSLGGKLAVVSNLGGIPGNLGAIGANITGIGSIFSSLTSSMNNIPGGNQQITNSIQRIGNIYQYKGNDISGAASQLQSDLTQGKYK